MDQYLSIVEGTEPPIHFHRWCLLSAIGALLGRRAYLSHGHITVFPNMYVVLVGVPATRKSTSIKMMKSHLRDIGYAHFSADRSTKEKYLLDLAGEEEVPHDAKKKDFNPDTYSFWGNKSDGPVESFIAADELTEFFGNDPISFAKLLGNLWDYVGAYRDRIKHGKSISIDNPTISLLGGITPSLLSETFPQSLIGQGFFSRILLIYGDPSGRKVSFPSDISSDVITAFQKELLTYLYLNVGKMSMSKGAMRILDHIYNIWKPLEDVRFEYYSNRRFIHLLKLCIIIAIINSHDEIQESDAIEANTILHHAEQVMPKAFGQFGKARNSDVVHKIISFIDVTDRALTLKDIWGAVHTDLEKIRDLVEILSNLQMAGKIQQVTELGRPGFLPIKQTIHKYDSSIFNWNVLTEEERKISI
jgi:hypothetical protein